MHEECTKNIILSKFRWRQSVTLITNMKCRQSQFRRSRRQKRYTSLNLYASHQSTSFSQPIEYEGSFCSLKIMQLSRDDVIKIYSHEKPTSSRFLIFWEDSNP